MCVKVSLDRYIITKDGQIFDKLHENKPIKYFKSNKYLQCCIYDENGKHVMGVHNVIAQAFSPNWFEGCVVHHKDNNQHNNNINNLQCLDQAMHGKFHSNRKYFSKLMHCPICGSGFVWKAQAQSHFYRNKPNRTDSPTCSRACAQILAKRSSPQQNNGKRIKCVETGNIYHSCMEASRQMGIYYHLINEVARGVHKTTHGYHFEYI